MLLMGNRPFKVYFVVAVTVDTYEQYVILVKRLI